MLEGIVRPEDAAPGFVWTPPCVTLKESPHDSLRVKGAVRCAEVLQEEHDGAPRGGPQGHWDHHVMRQGFRDLGQALGKRDHSHQRLLYRVEEVRHAGHRTHDVSFGSGTRMWQLAFSQSAGMVISGTVVFGTVTGPPPPPTDDEPEPDAAGFPAPLVRLTSTSSVPELAVVTNPPMLGLAISQSANTMGTSANA